jgi:hypothetical protein
MHLSFKIRYRARAAPMIIEPPRRPTDRRARDIDDGDATRARGRY